MKRVFIVHGWGGKPEEAWFQWMAKNLEEKGFTCSVPQMPDTDTPRIESWVGKLREIVGEPDGETYFIGHSIGCQAIMRYIECLDTKVGGCMLVAGFFHLTDKIKEDKDDEAIFKPWLETPIDCEKVKVNASNLVALFSDDDPWVDFSEAELFIKKLGARIALVYGKGHMGANDNLPEFPEGLYEFMEMVTNA